MDERPLVHVVDDELALRRSLTFLLSTAGYAVRSWESGEDFLKHADRATKATVVLDVRMPGIDGLEVQKRMVDVGLDFPVIVMTGHGDVSTAVIAMQQGAIDFLEKPVDRERLLDTVKLAFSAIKDRAQLVEQARWARIQLGKLTRREHETLDGLACGYPNKTIAHDLGIGSRTVEVYRANIMSKLDVVSFAEALRIAFAAGLGAVGDWDRKYRSPRRPSGSAQLSMNLPAQNVR
jgi:two-component system response regulator FixJ